MKFSFRIIFFIFLWLSLLPLCVQLELLSADPKAEMYFRLFMPGGVVVSYRVLEFEMFCLLMATVSQLR